MPAKTSNSSKKLTKKNKLFTNLANKATATKKSMLVTGLIGVLVFGGIGAYMTNRSNAAINYAGLCGNGWSLKKVLPMSVADAGENAGKYGEVRVYTKQSGSETNWCAFSVRKGSAYGSTGNTLVQIMQDRPGVPSQSLNLDEDRGEYQYYAGPVKLVNSNRVKVYGQVSGSFGTIVRIAYDKYLTN